MFSFGIRAAMLFSRKRLTNTASAVFGSGYVDGSLSAVVENYAFDSNAVTPGNNLSMGLRYKGVGFANHTMGVMACGTTATSSTYFNYAEIHNHANKTWTASSSMQKTRSGGGAVSNNAFAIIAGGGDAGGALAVSQSFTYSNQGMATGTNLGLARELMATMSNATVGIFAGGSGGTATYHTRVDQYTFSNHTVAAGSALSTGTNYGVGMNSPTTGYFIGGTTASAPGGVKTVRRYTMGTGAWASASALDMVANRYFMNAAGNATHGLWGGGHDNVNPQRITEKVTWTDETKVAGTNLIGTRFASMAFSTAPGGFAA